MRKGLVKVHQGIKASSSKIQVRRSRCVSEVHLCRDSIIEDRNEYTSNNVFWVPINARWDYLQDRAKQPEIGVLIDSAMDLTEAENPVLKGVLLGEDFVDNGDFGSHIVIACRQRLRRNR